MASILTKYLFFKVSSKSVFVVDYWKLFMQPALKISVCYHYCLISLLRVAPLLSTSKAFRKIIILNLPASP